MRRDRALLNNLFFPVLIFFRFLVRLLPEGLCYSLGRGLGLLAYMILSERRRTTVNNITLALGLQGKQAHDLAKASFISLGLFGAEYLRFSGRRKLLAERVTIKGLEHLQAALAGGSGVILLNAHLGNLELAGQALVLAGYRIHPIVRVQTGGLFNAMIDRERRAVGAEPIELGFTLRAMLNALKQNEIVQIMPDQHTTEKKRVLIPFFGHPAWTPRGLDVIARLSNAPVVPVFAHRTRPGYHEVNFYPPLHMVRTDDEEADTITNMTRVNALLEEVIREHPEQWFWMHKRWKVNPEKKRRE